MSSPTTSIIVRQHLGTAIPQRASDQYVNATAMCSAFGKKWYGFFRTDSTQEYLTHLSVETGLPITQKNAIGKPALVEAVTGHYGGTWVHPRLAVQLAQWCSPIFADQVSRWVQELLTSGTVSLSTKPTLKPYSDRLMAAVAMAHEVPEGCFTIFEECAWLLIDAEQIFTLAKLPMDQFDLLDGSVGRRWSDYRKGKPWAGHRYTYLHRFQDHRGNRPCAAYCHSELRYFKAWLRTIYHKQHFANYIRDKYGSQALICAAPALERRGISIALGGVIPGNGALNA